MVSSMRVRPPEPFIIRVLTSSVAIIEYCGEVELYIMKASLNSSLSTTSSLPFLTWIMDAWERAASSLWVDWVANTGGC